MGLDPGFGKNLSRIPDPGINKNRISDPDTQLWLKLGYIETTG
jgi:hypothetical protein